jgi:hypothetical protein
MVEFPSGPSESRTVATALSLVRHLFASEFGSASTGLSDTASDSSRGLGYNEQGINLNASSDNINHEAEANRRYMSSENGNSLASKLVS